MNDRNYTTSFTVDQTPAEAFASIDDVRGWWSENIEGATDKLNGEFKFHNEPVHYCRIKVTELVAGNEIVFDIARRGDKTDVVFTHIGLVPAYECFDICSDARGGYVRGSLRALIAEGKGAPIRKAA